MITRSKMLLAAACVTLPAILMIGCGPRTSNEAKPTRVEWLGARYRHPDRHLDVSVVGHRKCTSELSEGRRVKISIRCTSRCNDECITLVGASLSRPLNDRKVIDAFDGEARLVCDAPLNPLPEGCSAPAELPHGAVTSGPIDGAPVPG